MKYNVMHWKSGRSVGFILMITFVCLTVALASSAARDRHERFQVLGTIENVDRAAGTITVRLSDGTDKTLRLDKRLKVNGHDERSSHAESALIVQERAVIYYKSDGADDTAVEVESLNHVMRKTVTGTLISADKDSKTVVLRTANGKEETFRVKNEAVIETADNVTTFERFEPQAGTQITLHYEDPVGLVEVSRIKR